MNITNVTNVWPPPSPPGLAELQQIVLNELDGGGRQWIGWCIASAVLLGSACFVAHGCWVQCANTCVVLQARLSGRSGMAAAEGPAVPPQAMLRLRCLAVPSNHRAARLISSHPLPALPPCPYSQIPEHSESQPPCTPDPPSTVLQARGHQQHRRHDSRDAAAACGLCALR